MSASVRPSPSSRLGDFDSQLDASPLLRAALDLATEAHRGQTRHHGPPYILHPISVARRLFAATPEGTEPDLELCAAGLLHDALEDSEAVTAERIEAVAGPRVRALVEAVSKPAGMAKKDYLAALATAPIDARRLKVADRTDNLRDLLLQSDRSFTERYVAETETYLVPLAREVGGTLERHLLDALDAARAHRHR